MKTLVINAGSTNVKFAVLDGEDELYAISSEHRSPSDTLRDGLDEVRKAGHFFDAVGHRIVHGGPRFVEAVAVDDRVMAELEKLNDLAPLHNPPAFTILEEARKQLPNIPHIAAFDTAFHSTISEVARTYAIPWQWTKEWGLRKYGFHGLSYAYCSRCAAEMLGRIGDPHLRLVVAHLGGGCSLAAIEGGISRDTTMGFTPLDGLMMASRSGSVDPGVIFHAMRHQGLSMDDVEKALNQESGLLGVSGISNDFREVSASADAKNDRAKLAEALFQYRIQLGIGTMAAALGGVDALVFTAGIGEHAAPLRANICKTLGYLGIQLDEERNASLSPDAEISSRNSTCRVLVIHTREAVTIAREVSRILTIPPNDSA